MSQRGVPVISPKDLRDHATAERLERIWQRVEADLATLEPAPPRSRWAFAAAAAAVATFGAGLLVGKMVWQVSPSVTPAAAVAPSHDLTPPATDLLATGSQPRTFAIPGGGQISLGPSTTIELVQRPNAVDLRLLQGEATIETLHGSRSHLIALQAEEARVETQAGSQLRVRRVADHLHVTVDSGQANVLSPAGAQQLRAGEQADAVPLRTVQASAVPSAVRPRLSSPRTGPSVTATPQPIATQPQAADWRKYADSNFKEALRLLREQPGGIMGAIQSARDARELMDIHDVVAIDEPQAALAALTRITESFPTDQLAQVAAYQLGVIHQQTDPAKAQQYLELATSFRGVLAEDALCKQIRNAAHNDEAIRLAQEYLNQYPDGRCRQQAQNVLDGETGEEEAQPAGAAPESETEPEADAGSP